MTTATETPEARPVDLGELRESFDHERQKLRQELNLAIFGEARGKPWPRAKLRALLAATGTTLDEFEQPATALARRFQATGKAANADELTPAINAALKAANAAGDVYREGQRRRAEEEDAERHAWFAKRSEFELLTEQRRRAKSDSQDLLLATSHPWFRERQAEIDDQATDLRNERNRLSMNVPAYETPHANQQRQGRIAEIDAALVELAAEKTQLQADRMDPVKGLLLGTPETSPEVLAKRTWSTIRAWFTPEARLEAAMKAKE